MERIGVIAGSFDPITLGHQWMIEQALDLVDFLYVVVGTNSSKKCMFSVDERVEMIHQVMGRFSTRMQIVTTDTQLLADFAVSVGAECLIRGVRNSNDLVYESDMQLINRKIQPTLKTIFLIPPRELVEVSSSTVRGLIGFDNASKVVADYVDPYVLQCLLNKVSNV